MYFLGGGGFQVTTLNYGLFVSGPKYYNVTELEHCFYPYGFNVTLTNYIFHRSIPPSLGGGGGGGGCTKTCLQFIFMSIIFI